MRNISSGKWAACVAAVVAVGGWAGLAQAVDVAMTDALPNNGYMNVFELPANGGGYVFGSPWAPGDLRANWGGGVLKLEAAPLGTGDAFWYQNGTGGAGADGNKQMEANYYVEDDSLGGQSVTFSMNVLENTFVDGYVAIAFIKEFAPDYSSFTQETAALTPGVFSISKSTSAGNHIQYGFQVVGANVWPTDVESKGYATIAAVPEPATLVSLSAAGLLVARRRRNG